MTLSPPAVSHDELEETPAAKARWFQSLTLDQRMALLCEYTDLALNRNPGLGTDRPAQPIAGRVQVLELP